MGLALKPGQGVPAETATAARKIYNIQHIYLRIGDELDSILQGIDLAQLDPSASLNSDAVYRLALVTAFQYAELLPDPLAEQATTRRMDWKYALRLPIQHPGMAEAALCNFRQNLFSFPNSAKEYSRLLAALGQCGLFARSDSQSLGAAQVLTTVCKITRLYWLNQGMRAALSALAAVAPEWLSEVALPHWYEHYKTDQEGGAQFQAAFADPLQEANTLGADASRLLNALRQQKSLEYIQLDEIVHLSRLVEKQYLPNNGSAHWRMPGCLGCSRND